MPAPRPGRRVTFGLLATAAVALVAPVSARAAPRVEDPSVGSCSASAAWSCTATSALDAAAARTLRHLSVGTDATFPIVGRHDWGRSEANKFGGGRGHKGLDMFAACGTPVVAAASGKVEKAAYEGAAGNYVVVALRDRRAHVYMHLRHPARVHKGERVFGGERLGSVGRTGDADGCHLHFELWTAPGWFRGRAVDPEPSLRRWATK
jgi:murein DD-endopeptidase MepM/ murein hydrolase activator NlpD